MNAEDTGPREHRVVGPPGCGKTTYLARQANRAAQRVGGGAVLIASLTRAAAREVAGRDTAIPPENIGTLHAHAFRALNRPSLADDKDGIKAWNEWVHARGTPALTLSNMQSDMEHQPLEAGSGGGTLGDDARALVDSYRARMWPVEVWPDTDAVAFWETWLEWKSECDRLDFTDLIEQCIARELHPSSEPQIMMLDEAQDMSRLEMTLARMWGSECEQLVVVGDPQQNLYEWRGSEPEAFFAAEAASERVLDQSYRVPEAVHAYALSWISQLSGYREFAYKPVAKPGEVRLLQTHRWQQAGGLHVEIDVDLQAGRTVMILASCGYMLKPLIHSLREAGVPFHNPYRVTQGAWNPLRGTERLAAFLRPDKDTWGDAQRMWSWEDVKAWIEPLASRGLLTRGAKTLVEARCLGGRGADRFGEKPGDETIDVDNFLGLFVSEEDASRAWDMDVAWWQSNLLGAKAERLAYGVELYRRHGGTALTTEPRVIVGTIHSVKGGEADSVYVWPDLSQRGYVTGWLGREGHPSRDPTVRLFYVAFTRAIKRLTLLPKSGEQCVVFPTKGAQAA